MPSAGVSNSDLLDLTRTTLQNLPDLEFEVALKYQEYPVCNQWFASDKVQIESGTSIERNIILDTSGNARFVRLYQKTPVNVADVQQKITAPWVQVQTHWSIERREALRNRAPARYVELIKSRRVDATVDLADLLEEKAWASPSSATDDLNPRGLPYWLSKRGAAAATVAGDAGQGFDAYLVRYGTGVSNSKGGIDGSTSANDRWKNYAASYVAINAEFVRRMRRAFHATHFRSPTLARDLTKGPMSKYRIYMALTQLTEYEDLATKQNDNLGRDLDPFHGATTFKRVPITYTPQLDGATDSPVYGVCHNKFFPFTQSGDWMRESEPMTDVEQHNVITSFVDSSFNFFCTNVREGGFVLHTVG